MPDLRESIQAALSSVENFPLRDSAIGLLSTLGYRSDRTIDFGNSNPKAFLNFIHTQSTEAPFSESKALFEFWKSADLLFQLTDEELGSSQSLFQDTDVKPSLLRSYLFFAIELTGEGHARGKLTGIARQINRVFPMPVMVLIKHVADKKPVLSIAVINRRQNKREAVKDVLGKVTIIRDISLNTPHRGHLDILASFARANLVHPQRLPINNFDTLHAAWEEIFNVELLNKRFYRELANWYFWALPQVDFPADTEPDDEKRRATSLIRLLTRLIFCWFLKEKGLVPGALFNESDLGKILTGLSPDACTYHQAILQNLFFATLNQRMGKDRNGRPFRAFARDEGFQKNRATYGVDTLYRYEEYFRDPGTALQQFAEVPFLNGGLFECLDRTEEDTDRKLYLDGFSRNKKKRPIVPNRLFFAREQSGIDLSKAYGESNRRNEKVRGLLHILHSYKFTVVENTPIDQEIALDPELLGKVFENLLASYNEETKTTARKQTGSFYTPRPIVEFMVDESLKAHLTGVLIKASMIEKDAETGLEILFAYTERQHPFHEQEVAALLEAIHTCKILDPACGSGAFPMGMLHKLVYIIHKLDPDNARWKKIQIDAAGKIPDSSARDAAIAAIERDFADNEDDYGRKLYLIENCLYGVDIQPIAIQISKLRFFISLVCDQKINRSKKENLGIRPLPNLETKFVAADTLIGLPEMDQLALVDPRVHKIEAEIESLYHSHFAIQRRDQKLAVQKKIKELRKELGNLLVKSLGSSKKAQHIADWDAFDPQTSSDFFDPHWMFGASLVCGFDIVIGNPPYISVERFAGTPIQAKWQETFTTYAARGDVYCLFYERGAGLLRKGGTLAYITSNKWMRTGYGEKLRAFLSSKVKTESVLDFGMAQNFSAATTYTCVTRFKAEKPGGAVMSCYATDDVAAVSDPAGYFAVNAVSQKRFSANAWVVVSKVRQRIKELVEVQGLPLEKWDIQINYGVKTGYNEAFYLTAEERDALIAKDPNSKDLIGKLLRGRDIDRYKVNWSDSYQLIIKFDSHKNLANQYPAIYQHLCRFEKQLKARGQCKYGRERESNGSSMPYPGQHHWLELDNNPTDDFIGQFAKPKVMYPNMTKFLPFYLDAKDGFFTNDKGFIITSDRESLCYIVAFLNSHVFRCCFRDNFPELMGNTYEVRKIFMDKIPIKKPSKLEIGTCESLVPLVQFAKRNGQESPAQFLEDLIDACVMECYFRDHMAQRDLLFLDDLAPHLADYGATASEAKQQEFLANLHRTLNAPSSKIRNRLLRLTADSPDLLAVIKAEGKV